MNLHRIGPLVLSLLLVPTIARADGAEIEARKKQAQVLSDEAFDEMEKKNYASACPKLERAVEAYPEGAGVKKTLASCYEASGRLASAWAQYELSARQAIQLDKKEIARESAQKAAELKPKLATVTIHVSDALRKLPGVVITRNGIPMSETSWETDVPVDVGEHVFEWMAPGYAGWSEKVLVAADGTHREVSVAAPKAVEAPIAVPQPAPPPPPPPPPSPPPPVLRPWQSPLGIATVGAGAVGLGTGGLLLGLAVGKNNESNAGHCNAQNICDETGLGLRHQAVGLRDGAVAAFVVGGVLAASGIVLLVTAPRANKATAIHWGVEVAPNQIGLRGAW